MATRRDTEERVAARKKIDRMVFFALMSRSVSSRSISVKTHPIEMLAMKADSTAVFCHWDSRRPWSCSLSTAAKSLWIGKVAAFALFSFWPGLHFAENGHFAEQATKASSTLRDTGEISRERDFFSQRVPFHAAELSCEIRGDRAIAEFQLFDLFFLHFSILPPPKTIEPAHVAVAVPTTIPSRRLVDLPDDALHCIFFHLDDSTLFALGCTCTRLATYLGDAASLWQSLAAAKCVTACAPLSARETLLHLRAVAERL